MYALNPEISTHSEDLNLCGVVYSNRTEDNGESHEIMVATIDLPGSFMAAARVKEGELDTFIRHSLAVELCMEGKLSLRKAAEVAGV